LKRLPLLKYIVQLSRIPLASAIFGIYNVLQGRQMEIDVEKRNGYVVITPICGQIDAGNYDELRKQIGSVLKTDHNILLNLENVQFLDSSAASVILYCYRNIQLHQGNFEICAPSIAVNVTLKLLKMDRLTKVFHSLEEAGRAFEDKINATQK